MDITQRPDIEQLIFDLYHNPANQTTANQCLTLAQASRDAWTFSWTFLAPTKPVEVQFFGASTLHLKISKCWHELEDNDSDKIALRNRLLETLVSFISSPTTSKVVETRLCLALASFVVHSVATFWSSSIDDLIQNISVDRLGSQVPAGKIIYTLVEVLQLIPEELQSLHVAHHEKSVIRCSLMKGIRQVFSVIDGVLRQQSLPSTEEVKGPTLTDMQQTAIRCFSNWSQHLGSLVLENDLHDPLLDLCLTKVSDEDLVSYTTEAVIAIYTHPEIHKYPTKILTLIEKIVQLENVLDQAISEENLDICVTMYSLYIQIAETHSRLLLDTVSSKADKRDVIFRLISIVLKCAATPGYYPVDETCSEQAFNFFYILQDDIIASDSDKAKEYMALFKPLYSTLIHTLLIKVQFPSDDVYKDWSSEDKESFRCYRQDIGDTFMYCYNMLRTTVLVSLQAAFTESLTKLSSVATVPSNSTIWQPLEAVIFALTSVAENITGEEDAPLAFIFESLTNIPFSASERLLASTIELIGAYCEWICHHPLVLPRVLTLLLLGGLRGQSTITTTATTMALKDLTRECQVQVVPYSQSILMACRDGLSDESHLKPKEKARLMCTIGQVLSVLPNHVIQSFLSELLPPIIDKLQVLTRTNHSEEQLGNLAVIHRNEVVNQLNMLTMMFSSIDLEVKKSMNSEEGNQTPVNTVEEPHPLSPLFQQLLPLLAEIGMKWMSDESVIEAVSECIKKAVLSLLDYVKPVVTQLLHLVTQLFVVSTQPSLVDVIRQLLLLFSSSAVPDDDLIKTQVISAYGQFCCHTIRSCQEMREKTNLIEYFFTTSSSLLKKVPQVFLEDKAGHNQGLFRLACSALILPERPTVKSVSAFLSEFIHKSRDSERMTSIVTQDGEALVSQIFVVITGTADSPRNVVEFMGDIIYALNQKYFDQLNQWLMTQVHREGFPSLRVSRENKENFVKLLLREKKNKRRQKDIVTEFALVSRGILGQDPTLTSQRVLPF